MPELPEVETVRLGLIDVFEGAVLTKVDQNRKNLRIPFPENFVKRLTGQRISHLGRRAKYLLVHFESGDCLIVHLGMSGRMVVEGRSDGPSPQGSSKHDHVIFHTDNGKRVIFNDPRRFGLMDLGQSAQLHEHRFFRDMGPEPLGNEFNEIYLRQVLKKRKTPIKSALLDQRVVSGLGNIYVCEALYRAGISPKRLANRVSGTRSDRLVPIIRQVIQEAIAAGGSSLKDYVNTDGDLGYFQHAFRVYDREGEYCTGKGYKTDCPGQIVRIVQANRSSFYCPKCQR